VRTAYTRDLSSYMFHKRRPFPGAWLVPLQLPGIQAFWPCNAVVSETGAIVDATAFGRHLTTDVANAVAVAEISTTWPGVSCLYTEPTGAGKNWLYRQDDSLGQITSVLTFGIWTKAIVLDKNMPISWQAGPSTKTGAMLRYGVDSGCWQFGYGTDGETLTYVTGDAAAADTWTLLVARFVGGTEATLFVNNVKYTSTDDIPEHIVEFPNGQNGWQLLPLDGFTDGTCPRIAAAWVCRFAVPDHVIGWLYAMQGPLFGR